GRPGAVRAVPAHPGDGRPGAWRNVLAMLDVVIIGAGAAGLAAAEVLSHAGLQLRVLEARPRIGGRVDTRHLQGWPGPLELGAEFIQGRARTLLHPPKPDHLRP